MIEMNNRNPGNRPNRSLPVLGFTLVEVMVTFALIGVVIALALPSYADMVNRHRLTSGAERLAAFINSGRTEATRRNQAVTVSYNRRDHKEWCIGVVVGEDACDCRETREGESNYCAIDGAKKVLSNADFDITELMHKMEGNNSLSFDPVRGILLDTGDDLLIELHTSDRDYKINLLVNESGNVKLCSKDDSHDLLGYEVCPIVEA